MKYLLIILCTVLSLNLLSGQENDTINQTDKNGYKQGYWNKYYPNGNMMYQGYFKENKPVGKMERFNDDGTKKAVMIFDVSGKKSNAELYFQDGTIAGKGIFIDSKKDGIWQYFSFYTHTLSAEETYNMGIKSGVFKSYYPNGTVSEEVEWVNDIRHGIWNQYFEDGKQKLKATYENGKVNGQYIVYYPTGRIFVIGHYLNNLRHGTWHFYDEENNVKEELKYTNGNVENEDEMIQKEQEYFKKMEENVGRIEEPTPYDFLPKGSY